jgi:hypothetical protein
MDVLRIARRFVAETRREKWRNSVFQAEGELVDALDADDEQEIQRVLLLMDILALQRRLMG